MSKLSREQEKEEELLNYINNPEYIDRIMFSLVDHSISFFFKNDTQVKLTFGKRFNFENIFLTNDLEEVFLNGVWLSDDEVDKAMLSFIYNVLHGNLEDFVFYCERLVMEFHKNR